MKQSICTDSSRNAKPSAQLVAESASRAIYSLPPTDRAIVNEPIRLSIAFYLPRPKKYQRRGVAVAHLTAPDIDKLLRGILDALTHVVWQDDSQVVELLAMKAYAEVEAPPRVDIRIERTTGARPVVVPPAPLPLLEVM